MSLPASRRRLAQHGYRQCSGAAAVDHALHGDACSRISTSPISTRKPFNYTPPADCPGPWAAVVFEADWSVDPGVQYDRTANIWIGGTNIFFGTTAEPSQNLHAHLAHGKQSDRYSPLFTMAQTGPGDLWLTWSTISTPATITAAPICSSIRWRRARQPPVPLTWCCRCRPARRAAPSL